LIALLRAGTRCPPPGNAPKGWAFTKPTPTRPSPSPGLAAIVGFRYLRPSTTKMRAMCGPVRPHSLRNSEPTNWVDEDRARAPKPQTLFGTATFAEAAPKMLELQSWTSAMWAARLTAAFENDATGEQLTGEILKHEAVQKALARFRADPNCW